MSSKEQFKDALKRDKQIIADLKKAIQEKDDVIKEQSHQIEILKARIDLKKKKWYQFWK
jgi:chromosome segregation ATPase